MAQKLVQIAVLCNVYSSCLHFQQPPFCAKTNLRENRFFAQDRRLVEKVASNNVKIYTENKTFVFANVRFSK
ncbi:hypothetical protein HMPREF2955_12500 [Prevotella sp. HMSC073D09]|nr:hypothetical protein HMPREF2955_12500 [Prevotella sp. HMSC073D09]